MFSLKDKVCVITGASRGVGLATTKRFAAAGAKVVMASRSSQTEQLAKELGCIFIKTDVSIEEEVAQLMKTTAEMYGRIDVLVNNAAIIIPENDIIHTDSAAAKEIFDVNYFGYLYGIKHAVPYMPDEASIINVSSNAGVQTFPGYGPYNSSKAAINGLTKTAALELADRKIRVNAICPASIDTPMLYQEGCENELAMGQYCWPLGRFCTAEECAALIHFLAADDCKYITGEDIQIDGGYTAGIGRRGMLKWIES
ncbi:SDR family oxidoreductase [Neobacillus sp. OS1-32]|uniref:SDR family NAD(P)-dependent oxidoreductase n=1 Tax=Neobacillus sp. OS1-32 TaxID=3070682 RepID=UPI0027E111ED|nr:SDR family oxidoreductase [Neobacillus sp. OS1-32]WML31754.1 SDR family oxidoreductase [Neobacillus sp. OS1-32]